MKYSANGIDSTHEKYKSKQSLVLPLRREGFLEPSVSVSKAYHSVLIVNQVRVRDKCQTTWVLPTNNCNIFELISCIKLAYPKIRLNGRQLLSKT